MSKRRVRTTVETLELVVTGTPAELAAIVAALPLKIGGKKRTAVTGMARVRQLLPAATAPSIAPTRLRLPARN